MQLNLNYLSERMRQTGDLKEGGSLSVEQFLKRLYKRINELNVDLAKEDMLPFQRDPSASADWSRELFYFLAEKTEILR